MRGPYAHPPQSLDTRELPWPRSVCVGRARLMIKVRQKHTIGGVHCGSYSESQTRSSRSLYTIQRLQMPHSHHSHSGQFCKHASGTLEEVVLAAIDRGFKTFALTEHCPRFRDKDLYPEEIEVSECFTNLFYPGNSNDPRAVLSESPFLGWHHSHRSCGDVRRVLGPGNPP